MEDKIIINGIVLDNNDQDLINQAYIDQYGKLDYESPDFNNRMDALAKDYMGWKKGELDKSSSKLINSSWTDLKTQASPQYHNALMHLSGMPISSLNQPIEYTAPEVKVTAEKKKRFVGPVEEVDYSPQREFKFEPEIAEANKQEQYDPFTKYAGDFLVKTAGKVWQGIGSFLSDVGRAKAELQKNQESLEDYDVQEAVSKINKAEKGIFTKPAERVKQEFIKDVEQVPIIDEKTGSVSPKGFAQGITGIASTIAPYTIPVEGIGALTADIATSKLGRWGINLTSNFMNQFPKVFYLTKGESLEQADKMGLSEEDAHKFATANGLATTFAFSLPGSFLNLNPYKNTLSKFILNPKNLSTTRQMLNFGTGAAMSGTSGALATVGEKVAKDLYAENRIPMQGDLVTAKLPNNQVVKEKITGVFEDGTYKVGDLDVPFQAADIQLEPEEYLSKEAIKEYGKSFLSMAALHGLMDYKGAGRMFKNNNSYYTNTVADMASPKNFANSVTQISREINSGVVSPEQGRKAISLLNKIQPYVTDAMVSMENNPRFNKKYFGNYVFASAEREDLINKRNQAAKQMSTSLSEGEEVQVRDNNGKVVTSNATVESINEGPDGNIQFKVSGIDAPVSAENIIPVRNTEAADKMEAISNKINTVSRDIKKIQDGNAFRGRLVTSNEVVQKASDASPDGRLKPFQVRSMAEIPLGFFSEVANPLRFENDPIVKKHIKDIESGSLKVTGEETTMPIVLDENGNIIDGRKRVAQAIVEARRGRLGNVDNSFEVLRPITFAEAAKNVSDMHDSDPEVQRQYWDNMKVPGTPEAATQLGVEEIPVDMNIKQATSKVFQDTKTKIADNDEDVDATDVLDGNVEGAFIDEATNTTVTAAEKIKTFLEYYNTLPESEKVKALNDFVKTLNSTVDANGRKVYGKNPEFEAFKAAVDFLRKMGVPKEDLASALHNGLLPSYNDQGRVEGYINGALKIMERKGMLKDDVITFADIETKRQAEAKAAEEKKLREEKRNSNKEMKLNQFAERVASKGKLAFAKNKAEQDYYNRNKAEIDRRAEIVKEAKKQQAEKEARTEEGFEVVGQVEGKPIATVEVVEEVKPEEPQKETLVGANVLGKDATGAEVKGQVINEMANGDLIVKTDSGNVIIKSGDILEIGGKTAIIPDEITVATEEQPFEFESGMEEQTTETEAAKPEYTQKAKEAEFTRPENMKDVKDLFDQLRRLKLLESKGKDCL